MCDCLVMPGLSAGRGKGTCVLGTYHPDPGSPRAPALLTSPHNTYHWITWPLSKVDLTMAPPPQQQTKLVSLNGVKD
jgi:hypothetical protein